MWLSFINFTVIFKLLLLVRLYGCSSLELKSSEFDNVIKEKEFVFINFYATWCRFSEMLQPTWNDLASECAKKWPNKRLVIARVNAENERSIASRFHVTKYPTMILLRDGQAESREYRGKRDVSSFTKYLEEQMTDAFIKISTPEEIPAVCENKRFITYEAENEGGKHFEVFRKVSNRLKSDCKFFVKIGSMDKSASGGGKARIVYQEKPESEKLPFEQNMGVFDEVLIWATNLCVPPVRQITFDNAEELTEEGLPFLILFHHPDDNDIVEKFTNLVKEHHTLDKQRVNFLHADGIVFEHPLHHLGKSKQDLPLIAIDSFRHMYLFKDIKNMDKPGKLKKFIDDLHSGKLHREFHYGPDPADADDGDEGEENPDEKRPGAPPTSPPESTFAKLKPSRNRYSIPIKDEF